MKDLRTGWSGEYAVTSQADSSDIPRAMRDLAALATLPSIWVDCEVGRGIQNLTDILRAALRAFTVCVRVELSDGRPFETASSEGLSNKQNPPSEARELLNAVESSSTEPLEISNFNGSGPLNALPQPIFFEGRQIGYFVACYQADVLPSPSDRLLLHVAASQVVLLLQRHKAQEERFARKFAEDRLRQTEHHYQQLVQSLPAAVYTCDNDGRVTLYNEAAAALWGRRPKIGEDLWCNSGKIFNTDGKPLPLEECPMAIAIREGRSVRGQEIIVERPDGTRTFVLPHPDPIRDESGAIIGTVNMLVVVDELKSAEGELRKNQAQLKADLADTRLLQEISATLIHEKDVQLLFEKILEAAVRIMRSEMGSMQVYDPREDALHLLAWHGFGPDFGTVFKWVRPETKTCCSLARQLGRRAIVPDIESSDFFAGDPALEGHRATGIRAAQSTPLYSRGGQLVGMISTHWAHPHEPSDRDLGLLDILARQAADLLERRQADEALRESEEKYRTLFESIEDGFCSIKVLFDHNEKPLDYRFLLVNPAFERQTGIPNAAGRSMREIAPLHEEYWFEIYGRIALTGEPMRFERRAEQLGRQYEVYAWRLGEPAERKVGVLFHDITERKRGEESASRLAAIVEHSDDAIFSTDLNGVIKSWNRGAERLYGYPADEVIGQPLIMLIPENRRDEESGILSRIRQARTIENFETVRRRKDGTVFDVSLVVSPIKDNKGNVIGISKVARDITDKVRAKEKLEQTVAERTASLRAAVAQMEEFSYTVSHDLRAPLRGMRVYTDALLQDFAPTLPPEASHYLNRISVNANRLDKMILDVLTFSRLARAELRLERVQVDKLIRQIVEQYPGMQASEAHIEINPLPDFWGHEPSLTQALSNLLNNAVKFVRPAVRPIVKVWSESRNHRVRLWISDNGIGIDPKYHHRLFNMFERVHPHLKYDGTGVGLAIVRKAMERMGGTVGMESDGSNGCRFWVEADGADGK